MGQIITAAYCVDAIRERGSHIALPDGFTSRHVASADYLALLVNKANNNETSFSGGGTC